MLKKLLNSIFRASFLALILLSLWGCGQSQSGKSTPDNNIDETTPSLHSGSVGDGPIIGAAITFKGANGISFSKISNNGSASYSVQIPDDMTYPVTISAAGGIDTVTQKAPTFTLFSIAPTKTQRTVNINPFTTLILKSARLLPGGLTPANIDRMTSVVVNIFNFGLDRTKVPNPIYTAIDENNIVTLVKAGEALAEMIKRTHAILLLANDEPDISQDLLIDALAADITDGILDGIGTSRAEPRYAAIANIFAAQIIVEILSNNFMVEDKRVGLQDIDKAIHLVMPSLPETVSTLDERISSELLGQARTTLDAALDISNDLELFQIDSILSNISPGDSPRDTPVVTSNEISLLYDIASKISGENSNNQWEVVNYSVRSSSITNNSNFIPGRKIPVVSITAPAAIDAAHSSDKIIDGIGWSYWAAYGMPDSIVLDLGAAHQIGSVLISFLNYDQGRTYNYSLSISDDNIGWIEVVNKRQSGIKRWTENPLQSASARYVKITINSANNSSWIGILEIEVVEPATQPTPQIPNAPGTSGNNSTSSFAGRNDSVIVLQNSFINVDILSNDLGINLQTIQVEFYSLPLHGTVVLNSDISIAYTPTSNFVGWDSLTYVIYDDQGNTSYAEVFIRVQCSSCNPVNIDVTLDWTANSDSIDGYMVHYGPTPESAIIPLHIQPLNQSGFNPAKPSVSFNAADDLGLNVGDTVCFKLKTYSMLLESNFSDAICITL